MSADAQQNILVQLQGDAIPPTEVKSAVAPNLTPVGIVNPPEPKKRTKKPASEAPATEEAPKKRKRSPAKDDDVKEEEEEEEEEQPKRQHKRKRPIQPAAAAAVDEEQALPKKKKKAAPKRPPIDTDDVQTKKKSSAPRKQPGYAMIKTEDDRLRGALDALIRKRDQRETASSGRATTSTCGVLTNNLIDFYEGVVDSFGRKFGRYIN